LAEIQKGASANATAMGKLLFGAEGVKSLNDLEQEKWASEL
jgi:hypothetical protein